MRKRLARIIGIVLAFVLLFGGSQIMAKAPTNAEKGRMSNATQVYSNQSVTVSLPAGTNGAWYRFDSTAHRVTRIYASDASSGTTPHLILYDANGTKLMDSATDSDCPEVVIDNVTEDSSFYIWASRTSSSSAGSYSLRVREDAYTVCLNPGGVTEYLTSDVYTCFLENRESADLQVSVWKSTDSSIAYTYQWFRVGSNGSKTKINGATSKTFTATADDGDHLCVEVRSRYRTRRFDFYLNWGGYFAFSDLCSYYLTEAGSECTVQAPALSVSNFGIPAEYVLTDPNDEVADRYRSQDGSFTLRNRTVTASYSVNAVSDFLRSKTSFILLFVRDSSNTRRIRLNTDESVSNVSEGSITGAVFFEFTPDVSGTYTFGMTGTKPLYYTLLLFGNGGKSLDEAGNSLMAFDSEYQYTTLPETDHITADLTAGRTYYFAAMGGNQLGNYSGSFNVRLTLDRAAPTSSPTSAPTAAPTSRPTTAPTSAPTSIPAPTNAPVTPSRSYSIGDFVERLYTVALGRNFDEQGRQDWVDAATLRGQTGADLARGFLYSPEFLNKNVSNTDFVRVLYRTFFDREADAAGLAGWVSVLDNGGSKEHVIEGFINSTEWANLCLLYGVRSGGTGTPSVQIEPSQGTIDFCTRLYTTCLSRDADSNGLMAWARQLANQRDTGAGAAHGFFFGTEFTRQNVDNPEFVRRLYRTFMGREPDDAGFNAWVGALNSGTSREEVFRGFAESPEFARICASYGIIRS